MFGIYGAVDRGARPSGSTCRRRAAAATAEAACRRNLSSDAFRRKKTAKGDEAGAGSRRRSREHGAGGAGRTRRPSAPRKHRKPGGEPESATWEARQQRPPLPRSPGAVTNAAPPANSHRRRRTRSGVQVAKVDGRVRCCSGGCEPCDATSASRCRIHCRRLALPVRRREPPDLQPASRSGQKAGLQMDVIRWARRLAVVAQQRQ